MFEIGELIIYGGEGVCRVESIGAPAVSGADKSRLYYTLAPLYRAGKVFAPVDTPVFMRHVIGRREAVELIRSIPSAEVEVYENRNLRFLSEHYQKSLQTHECMDLVKLIKAVHLKRKNAEQNGKKLGQIDEKYMKHAENILYGELSVALDVPRESITDYLRSAIQKVEAGEEWDG